MEGACLCAGPAGTQGCFCLGCSARSSVFHRRTPRTTIRGCVPLTTFIHGLVCQTGNMVCFLFDGHSVMYKQDLISSNVPLAPSLTSHAPSPCSGFSPRPSDMLCACLLVVYLVSVSSIRAGLSVLFTAESSSPGAQQALSKYVLTMLTIN